MAKGILCDVNLALTGTITGPAGGATADQPLANLLNDEDYVGRPWRCPDATALSLTWFEQVFPEPHVFTVLGLFFHTFSMGARYRLRGSTLADATYAAPTVDTGWRWVHPSIIDPVDLPFGVENGFAGTVTAAELALHGRHLAAKVPEGLVERIRIDFDDQENPAGWFDVGGLLLADGFSPEMNHNFDHELGGIARDQVDETPSGRRIADSRPPRRTVTASYENLSAAEARRFVDAGLRRRATRTVLFVPNIDQPDAALREAFPATFARLPGARIGRPGMSGSTVSLEEVLA